MGSEIQLNIPKGHDQINCYFDGARAAIRLYAVWRNGEQLVGAGRPINDALNELERMRQEALDREG